ncbi:MAG: PAS domain S-box protein [Planktothrix sp. GU0601_MAG3]|nr:MAG: PAS domain S-box protein [Planktothrix sp. GU0601_MAG3]
MGLWTANAETGQHLYLYNIDAEGRPTTLYKDSGAIYDPRKRPWYEKAQTTGRPVWSDIYLAFSTGLPTVTASQPIYNPDTGELLGVCATDVLLPDDFRKFLSSLTIGKSGIAFVSDRTGQLLSSSTNEILTVGKGKQAKLLPAADSQNPLIRGATQQIILQYGSFANLDQPVQTEFLLNNQRKFIQVLPFKDGRGLDWLIVVVIPERDFMDEINANNRLTIILCLVALAVAILAGIATSRWISQPILKLSQASKAIAQGQLDQHIETKGITEIEILASSFNTMTYQLQESFAKLEAKNADLEQAKEALFAAKEQLEAVLNAVPGSISWMNAEGIYLGVNRHLADNLSLETEEILGQKIGFFEQGSDYVKFLHQFLESPEQSASQILPIIQNNQRRYYLIVVQKYQQGSASVAVGIDITERRQAEEALRIAEENYRSIYENALEGIFQYHPEHSYINVNPSMARIYGYDSPQALMEILQDSSYSLYVQMERHQEFINLMEEQETVSNFEFQIYRADRHKIWISASAKPVFNPGGNLLYYQGFIADITERKKAEVERQQFIEELFEVNSNLEVAMQTQLELTEAATRFVPQQFLSLLGYNSIAEVKLGEGVQHEMSILFSDIRDFTALSEKMTPEDNFQFINSYLSRMEPAITQHQGFIDKYIGDAIMALFNGGADDAIKAGITMLQELVEYNSHRGRPDRPTVSIGIGINTGSLMLGNRGRRKSYG